MDDERLYTLDEAHGEFASQLNGEVWELLDTADRSSADDERMLYAAWASAYHWLRAGTAVHHQRAEWMLSRVYTCLLYTSDAADDLLCVDLGGRRIIKK